MTATHIDTLALGASSMPLTVAAKDPRPVFTAADVSAFTGRDWLSSEIDRFIAAHPCGYVFIEAEAGLGKTAFAAWLVKTRGYLSHFSRYAGGSTVQVALANLAAQLITKFEMDEVAPGGMLPEWAWTPSGFESILTAAAEHAAEQQRPLVLVVDGLDDADTPAQCLPFGLSSLLPEDVFIVGTYRTGRAPRRPDAPTATVRIAKEDHRNQRDIHEYLAKAASEDVLAARLAAAQMDSAEFTSQLASRCGGVWVYLRYVLNELRFGLRQPTEISDLPSGLRGYYADQIRRWQHDPAWHTGLLPLLATLAAAREPLPARSLARLAGNIDPAAVQRWCDLTIRPLLTTIRMPDRGTPLHYEIYHASFREFLTADHHDPLTSPHDQQPYEQLALADELRHAAATAHNRICDIYLTGFGGLAGGLPLLAGDPGAASIDGGYPLRHLARHLCHAGRVADLHALLAAEHQTGGHQTVNTWFTAHDHADHIAGYLNDLAQARADSATHTDRDLAHHRPAVTLGMEIRYALMAASIASFTASISHDLLQQLIRSNVWSAQRGLDHARRLTHPRTRADALLTVSDHVNTEEKTTVLGQALAAATAITDDYYRAEVLGALAPHLPAGLLAQALTAATAITDDYSRARALGALAPHLPAGQQATVLAQALAAATLTHDYSRAEALGALAPHLPAGLLAQALTAATTLTDDYSRARALGALAPHLPAGQQATVLAQALTAATALTDDYYRAEALGAGTPPARRPASPGTDHRHHPHQRPLPCRGAGRAGTPPARRPAGQRTVRDA